MDWLREHAAVNETVVNDGAADAGVWAPFKAATTIVLPRSYSAADAPERRRLVTQVAHLSTQPDLARLACALRVKYVYVGAKQAYYTDRTLPPLDVLAQSDELVLVFQDAGARIFRLDGPRCAAAPA